jgi:FkbM family methyltransferase
MNKKLKNKIKSLIEPLANIFGFERKHKKLILGKITNKDELILNFFEILKDIGFKPRHIIDVGANKGDWTRTVLKVFPDSNYSLVDPQKWLAIHFQDLLERNSNIRFFPYGAGGKTSKMKLTTHDRDDSFSFRFSEEEAAELKREQIEVDVFTLTDLVRNEGLYVPDLIKIDAEGIDLEVLDGCKDFFGKTEVILVEAAVMNKFFRNSCLAMLTYMDNVGYRLCDITDLNRNIKHGALWLVELAFIKKDGLIDNAFKSYA